MWLKETLKFGKLLFLINKTGYNSFCIRNWDVTRKIKHEVIG